MDTSIFRSLDSVLGLEALPPNGSEEVACKCESEFDFEAEGGDDDALCFEVAGQDVEIETYDEERIVDDLYFTLHDHMPSRYKVVPLAPAYPQ